MKRKNICMLLMVMMFTSSAPLFAQKVSPCDRICGKWMSSEKNLIIKIYKDVKEFKTKIVWFRDAESKKDINDYIDHRNPNPDLRDRKIIGMDIVEGLKYNNETKTWENGTIYDPKHGRFWDSSAYITNDGELKVTGYWNFKWIGKTMTFTRD